MEMNRINLIWVLSLAFMWSCESVGLDNRGFESRINEPIVRYREAIDVFYGPVSYNSIDVFYPENVYGNPSDVVILIHGGNWFFGDKWFLQPSVDELKKARKNLAIVNINYSLRVERTDRSLFEQQMADIDSCVNFLRKNAEKYNIRSDRFAIMGASAGAHLALSYSYTLGKSKVHTVVGMSAITELSSIFDLLAPALWGDVKGVTGYDEGKDNKEVLIKASPVHLATSDVPPTILLYGLKDDVIALRQQTLLRERLLALRVPNALYTLKDQDHNIEAGYVAESILGALGADEYDLYFAGY